MSQFTKGDTVRVTNGMLSTAGRTGMLLSHFQGSDREWIVGFASPPSRAVVLDSYLEVAEKAKTDGPYVEPPPRDPDWIKYFTALSAIANLSSDKNARALAFAAMRHSTKIADLPALIEAMYPSAQPEEIKP